ncbi:MAG: hypothetical protein M0C28_01770 [Candidatus Moduliflexus flocculans]|nr:hypothetical protein [Candidatus Moduliflexus flocculans]
MPEERIGEVPLRRPPKKQGLLRVVEVDGFDYSACGGTHVRRTGEIGAIKVLGSREDPGQPPLRVPLRRPGPARPPRQGPDRPPAGRRLLVRAGRRRRHRSSGSPSSTRP